MSTRLPPVSWQEVRDPKTGKLLFKYDPVANQIYIKRRNRHVIVRLPMSLGAPPVGAPHVTGLSRYPLLSQGDSEAAEGEVKDRPDLERGRRTLED